MNCRVCHGSNVVPVLDLGDQPHCNTLIPPSREGEPEPVYPLRLCFCRDCSTAQIDHTVPKEIMFSDYPYVSGTTRTLRAHFEDSANRLVKTLGLAPGSLVVDIGSNDGTWLKYFKAAGMRPLGVEPAGNLIELARRDGIDTLHRFFNAETARGILRDVGAPALVTAAGVFFHLEELHSATEGVALMCEAGAVFCVQAIYLGEMIAKNHFDNIYHEHLTYWSLTSISRLFDRHGLEAFEASLVPIHGGTMELLVAKKGARPIGPSVAAMRADEARRGFASIETYEAFARRVSVIRDQLLNILRRFRDEGKTVHALGAPAKGATLLNSFGITTDLVSLATERNPLKFGKRMPGSHIPIADEDATPPPDAYLVLPWNFLDEFLVKKRAYILGGGAFIVPLPEPHVIDKSNYAQYARG